VGLLPRDRHRYMRRNTAITKKEERVINYGSSATSDFRHARNALGLAGSAPAMTVAGNLSTRISNSSGDSARMATSTPVHRAHPIESLPPWQAACLRQGRDD
jgi:hypothetical protein